MKEINKKGSLLFIGIVVVLIFTAVIPIVRQQQESERDKGFFEYWSVPRMRMPRRFYRTLPGRKDRRGVWTRHRPWI
ncbi:MAG: hypothetical protein ACLR23_08090 [Clostridia bacterium]